MLFPWKLQCLEISLGHSALMSKERTKLWFTSYLESFHLHRGREPAQDQGGDESFGLLCYPPVSFQWKGLVMQ